jgi:DNA-binding FadR family transcriptional regulator
MGHRPVFCDIADDIRQMILKGELAAGCPTPPDDVLSTTYDVHPTTIRRAMEILETEGLVQRARGRWIVRRAETVTCLHRVLDAIDIGDAPDPTDVRTLAVLVIGLWRKRRVPYEPAGTVAVAAETAGEADASSDES